MKTDRLLDTLASEASVVRPGLAERRIAIACGVGLALSFLLVATVFGVRNDFSTVTATIFFKGAFGVAAAIAAAPLLLEVARPNASALRAAAPAALFALISTLLALIMFLLTPPEARAESWLGGGIPECLYRIPLLAVPIAGALFLAVRGLGPTRLTLAGGAIGGVSGGLGAIAYAACCPMDSALYVASWYLGAILFCTAFGAVAIGRALKW